MNRQTSPEHTFHTPVLKNETLALLDPKPGGVYVDATLGGGGLAAEILERIGPDGLLIGIDKDPEAIAYSEKRLAKYGSAARIVRGDFRDLKSILASQGVSVIDGAVFDLGVSSRQLDSARGFSFMRDEPLSMKMDPSSTGPDAADIVNTYSQDQLADLIRAFGEERYAKRIARAIVECRQKQPITTTGQLVDVIVRAVGGAYKTQKIHPSTRTFLALRLVVNKELEAIEQGLPAAIEALSEGGRVCVISFHSLEDRIVKTIMRRYAGKCVCPPAVLTCQCGAQKVVRVVTRKPVQPSEDEIRSNPRSRSAKLRCVEKLSSR
ncbi:MAG: 16S rRNA (cytosine(1402)-N(4))-methyltransferase RsmH [Armatimonadota bacterium]|nr:16S rRNA (cytosine(1402)-N(4))-methyltransferase RsmH [Armatimonadota bacterium]